MREYCLILKLKILILISNNRNLTIIYVSKEYRTYSDIMNGNREYVRERLLACILENVRGTRTWELVK